VLRIVFFDQTGLSDPEGHYTDLSGRIKDVPATKPSARARLLAAADELFYEHGVNAVGIDRVIERAGVAKASLYYSFGSKDELIRAYLEGRHAAWSARVDDALATRYDTARERLVGVFDVLAEQVAAPDFRGCAFTNASAESETGGAAGDAIGDFRTWVHDLFLGLATEAGAQEPERLARKLIVLYDGVSTAAALDHDPALAADAREVAATLVDAALLEQDRAATT
jgi:AcrR family transcriptional regulator